MGKDELLNGPQVDKLFVCDKHFSENQKFAATTSNRTNLKFDAVPDLGEHKIQNYIIYVHIYVIYMQTFCLQFFRTSR